MTLAWPPAFWIFSAAAFEKMCASISILRVISPVPSTLSPSPSLLMMPQLDQAVHRERVAWQLFQIAQIHDRILLLENVGEAALRQTAVQRHLAAFESAHDAVAGDGARALVTAGRRLAAARNPYRGRCAFSGASARRVV